MNEERDELGLGFAPAIAAGAGLLAPLVGKIFGGDEDDAAKKAAEAALKQQREATVFNTIQGEKTKRTLVTGLVIGGAILASVVLLYGAVKK